MSVNLRVPGILVTKPAQNLPQTATANLFTVSGGTVMISGLLGVVSTATGATATTLSLGVAPGAVIAAIATATSVASLAAGTCAIPNQGASTGAGGALVVRNAAFPSNPLFNMDSFILGAGTTAITWTTSASNTGQMQWYCWYIPIDAGASVS